MQQTQLELLNSEDVSRTIARIAHQIIEKTSLAADSPVMLLGIPSGGVPFAERLAAKIAEFSGITLATGSLDITLYRDDLLGKPHRALQPTKIPVSGVDGYTVILCDDVLFSGRTIRAALDAIRDLGRPEQVQLAVLVDRGHRQLPIRADYVGKNIPTARTEDVVVRIKELDGDDQVILKRTAVPETASTNSAGTLNTGTNSTEEEV